MLAVDCRPIIIIIGGHPATRPLGIVLKVGPPKSSFRIADNPFPIASIHLKTWQPLAPESFAAFYANFIFASRDLKRGSVR